MKVFTFKLRPDLTNKELDIAAKYQWNKYLSDMGFDINSRIQRQIDLYTIRGKAGLGGVK